MRAPDVVVAVERRVDLQHELHFGRSAHICAQLLRLPQDVALVELHEHHVGAELRLVATEGAASAASVAPPRLKVVVHLTQRLSMETAASLRTKLRGNVRVRGAVATRMTSAHVILCWEMSNAFCTKLVTQWRNVVLCVRVIEARTHGPNFT